jgi:CBS domain-containing protein
MLRPTSRTTTTKWHGGDVVRAKDIMSSPVHAVRQTDTVESATALMTAKAVTALPVLDSSGTLVGMVSRRDILRAVVRGDDVLTREVQHRLDEYADGQHRWTATVEGGIVRVAGDFDDDIELGVVTVLARTVPGVAAVDLGPARTPEVAG